MQTTKNARPGSGWAPTVAMSWLWGLGFFYSLHVTLTYGIAGFLAFAIPNALGLWLFGRNASRVLDRDPDFFGKASGPFLWLALGGQAFAVAVTVFAFVTYLSPLADAATLSAVAAFLVLVGCAAGRRHGIAGLRRTHRWCLAYGVAMASIAIVLAWYAARSEPPRDLPGPDSLDATFLGLVVPTLIGFLLGPWTDIQQWQRASEIKRAGGSVSAAYRNGAVLFFALLCVNAAFAAVMLPSLPEAAALHSDGTPSGPLTLFGAMGAASHPASIYVALWAAIALATTVDGSYAALRWVLGRAVAGSDSALLALVPKAFVETPLWWIGGGCALAAAAYGPGGGNMVYLMFPFATLLAAPALALVVRAAHPGTATDRGTELLFGSAALTMLCAGYTSGWAVLMALAPLVALLSLGTAPKDAATPTEARAEEAVPSAPPQEAAPLPAPSAAAAAPAGHDPAGAFRDGWFVLDLVPTYDDTNSVGNVYFANYVRWVGKAREMFFALSMPAFDLKTTDFYVLTKSFRHDFRREAAEFDPIQVRIRIGHNNRKFVTLVHEIHGAKQGLLGRGEQQLMFVGSSDYRPVDVPPSIIKGFLPYWPKGQAERSA